MLDRPSAAAVVRRFALPIAASSLAAGAILWPSTAWMWKTALLLLAGLLLVLTELPPPAFRGGAVRGGSVSLAILSAAAVTLALMVLALALGGPPGRLVPAALVLLALHLVGHLGEGGLVVRRASVEGALVLMAVLVTIGAEEAHRLEGSLFPRPPPPEAPVPEPPVVAQADGGEPSYSPRDPNLPPVFGGDGGQGGAAAGSCPEELTEENTALLWMRLQDRRDEGVALRDADAPTKAAAVVPRRLHCACTQQRERPTLNLAYCGRTRELCQSEAGTRAGTGSCSVVAVSVIRRVDCMLKARGVSVRSDDTSLSVTFRSVTAQSKLVPQWATLDARELARGRLVPLRVQRLRWSRGSSAPVEWRATNFPGASRAVAALGRSLTRTGLRCHGSTCEGGDGAVTVDWCEGTNAVAPGDTPPGGARDPANAGGADQATKALKKAGGAR